MDHLQDKSYLDFQAYKLMSVRLWNFIDGGSQNATFVSKNQHAQYIDLMLKGNRCILRYREYVPVCQKLGMILENKLVQKFKLEKNVFLQKIVS